MMKIFQVPSGEILNYGDETFIQYEDRGVREAKDAAFVLVAGGLGERLGYNGIKVIHLLIFSYHELVQFCWVWLVDNLT